MSIQQAPGCFGTLRSLKANPLFSYSYRLDLGWLWLGISRLVDSCSSTCNQNPRCCNSTTFSGQRVNQIKFKIRAALGDTTQSKEKLPTNRFEHFSNTKYVDADVQYFYISFSQRRASVVYPCAHIGRLEHCPSWIVALPSEPIR